LKLKEEEVEESKKKELAEEELKISCRVAIQVDLEDKQLNL
jgi:hypothetical protein